MFVCVNDSTHWYADNSTDGFCSKPECNGIGYLVEELSLLKGFHIWDGAQINPASVSTIPNKLKALSHPSLLVNPLDQTKEFESAALLAIRQRHLNYHNFLLAAFNLSRAIEAIHKNGRKHGNLSLSNVLIDAEDGRICLGDTGITAATEGFRAPELITEFSNPTAECDRHSLAVLLFYLTLFRHPFIGNTGSNWSPSLKTEDNAFGRNAVFTDHPVVNHNRFNGGMPFDSLPLSMREMFIDAFVNGLTIPAKRPTAHSWAREFWQALECMTRCTHCGQRFFINDERSACPFCDEKNPRECWWLTFQDGRRMLAEPGRILYEHHLLNQEFSFQTASAHLQLVKQVMCIKNLSKHEWRVHTTSGTSLLCGQGEAFRFRGVSSFDFGTGLAAIEKVRS